MSIIKTEKKTKFSETPAVKTFLDGLGSSNPPSTPTPIPEKDRWKVTFSSLSRRDQAKVIEFIEFLNYLQNNKKVLDKQAK